MPHRDPHAVLGLRPGATTGEIRAAYRRAALRWHPDRNPGDKGAERRFKEISEAYDALTNARGPGLGGPWPGPAGAHAPADLDAAAADALGAVKGVFGAVLETLFGADPSRGADVRVELVVDPREARRGALKAVRVARRQLCATCRGSGRQPARAPSCRRCGGHGVVTVDLGLVALSASCPDCGGGRAGPRCLGCAGEGVSEGEATVDLQVPPGARDGTTLRYDGQGDPARAPGGRPGDLLATVRVRCP